MTDQKRVDLGKAQWCWVAGVFLAVLGMQLALVAWCGTDVPFHDQWNIEGRMLYPGFLDGTLTLGDTLRAANEHRITWTHLMNLGLFAVNGQWDPLVQLVAIAGLRAGCAALLAAVALGAVSGGWRRCAVVVAVVALFLPVAAWHSVLWGIESHLYFALGFGWLALALLSQRELGRGGMAAGVLAAVAAMLAMGPGLLAPAGLLAVAAVRGIEARRWGVARGVAAVGVGLLAVALALRVEVAEHEVLRATAAAFAAALARLLSWPHEGSWAAALVMNAPLVALVGRRMLRRRTAAAGEDFAVAVAGWSVAIALATAWVRGGSEEMAAGVPSRYVDFLVGLPLANLWAGWVLAGEAAAGWRPARWVAAAWSVFLLAGWAGLTAETMRRLVVPLAERREEPVRLAREFQRGAGPEVFEGQPRLFVPHPNLAVVRAVLDDPRMRGKLPPSLQPGEKMGPLSRGARWLLGRGAEAEITPRGGASGER